MGCFPFGISARYDDERNRGRSGCVADDFMEVAAAARFRQAIRPRIPKHVAAFSYSGTQSVKRLHNSQTVDVARFEPSITSLQKCSLLRVFSANAFRRVTFQTF